MRTSVLSTAVGLGLSWLASAVHAQTATQFDLQCTGKIAHLIGSPPGSGDPWTGMIKVDLAQGRYCYDECQTPLPIQAVEPNRIVFRYDFQRSGQIVRMLIDRVTGHYEAQFHRYFATTEHPHVVDLISATCVPRPFSGLPSTRF